jgi:hypothetical protein
MQVQSNRGIFGDEDEATINTSASLPIDTISHISNSNSTQSIINSASNILMVKLP